MFFTTICKIYFLNSSKYFNVFCCCFFLFNTNHKTMIYFVRVGFGTPNPHYPGRDQGEMPLSRSAAQPLVMVMHQGRNTNKTR